MKVRLQARATRLPSILLTQARTQRTSQTQCAAQQRRLELSKPPHRTFSQSFRNKQSSPPNAQSQIKPNPSHFLTTTHNRIGKCITFGLTPSQLQLCSQILSILTQDWRLLLAGREGYVVSRAGVKGRRVIWGEQDGMGHVNNVNYVRYAETGRVEWLCNLAERKVERGRWAELMTPSGELGVILKSIRVDYKFPLKWPDSISVLHRLRAPPSAAADPSSFILDVLIVSEKHQRPAARCEEDIVVYDYKAGKKAPLPEFMREGFEKAWREQEEERIRAEKRIEEVEGLLRKLETESWDREDAVEDMGGATRS